MIIVRRKLHEAESGWIGQEKHSMHLERSSGVLRELERGKLQMTLVFRAAKCSSIPVCCSSAENLPSLPPQGQPDSSSSAAPLPEGLLPDCACTRLSASPASMETLYSCPYSMCSLRTDPRYSLQTPQATGCHCCANCPCTPTATLSAQVQVKALTMA